MSTAIIISNVSKIYRLGEIGTGTISRDLERWYKMRIKGQEDPFLKVGELNDRSSKGVSDIAYALKDINFECTQGEALGIIGKNGAGKSTLLKVLSRVTSPTTGRIKIKGRIASLLEIGTGFHPELTGRENIYLNGAILGMRKKEITRKLDEIIAFSGVERYVDTPVRRYSSGMYVRLAFAVAAHLESEIMIVDEVLAVGDAEFQKKCLGKMGEMRTGEGRTVLFVSHNMAAVQQLCQKGIILSNGHLTYSGTASEAVNQYINMTDKVSISLEDGFKNLEESREKIHKAKIFTKIRILDKNNHLCETFPMLSSMKIEVQLTNTENFPGVDYTIELVTSSGQYITSYASWMLLKNKITAPKNILLEIPKINFAPGNYHINLCMTHHNAGIWIDEIQNAISFYVESVDVFNTGKTFDAEYGLILPDGNLIIS
jgi:lipopolysaccharide transport system ATP-binding protein